MTDDRDRDRDRLGPPPIDPLPDLTWARVERSVLAELDAGQTTLVTRPAPPRGGRGWLISAGIGAAIGAAAAIALLAVGVGDPSSDRVAADGVGPTRVVTGDASSEVSFGDAHVVVAPGSAVVLSGSAERGVLAMLDRGSATFSVAPRRGRPAYVVQAGAVAVRVVGTEFTVARDGDDAAVDVIHGAVEVVHRGASVPVGAGSRWTSRTEIVVASPPDTTPAPPPPVEPPSIKPPPIPEQERFEAAAKLEAADPAAALAGYRELARGRSAWAGNALYAVARLSYDRGDRDRARRASADYLRRFPRGPNAADARALLARIKGER